MSTDPKTNETSNAVDNKEKTPVLPAPEPTMTVKVPEDKSEEIIKSQRKEISALKKEKEALQQALDAQKAIHDGDLLKIQTLQNNYNTLQVLSKKVADAIEANTRCFAANVLNIIEKGA